MTAKDGTEVTARSAGPQAADLLTKHFKQTTERMTDEEAIAITERVVRRRQEENRRLPDRFPHAKDLLNHVKRHLIETDEWLANRQAKGGSLEQTTPEAAPALPPANSKHCGRAFSIAEVAACKHKRKGKATWHEKITTEMMDEAGPLWDQCFATMLNLTLLTGSWPLWFKDARMRHLIKPKAKTYSSAVDAKHTRPISIIPAMAKRADAMRAPSWATRSLVSARRGDAWTTSSRTCRRSRATGEEDGFAWRCAGTGSRPTTKCITQACYGS
jgi:hypothetical protein